MSDEHTCGTVPSMSDILLVTITLSIFFFVLLYILCLKIPSNSNVLCTVTKYIFFERLGIMQSGSIYLLFPFWRRAIRKSDGSFIELSKDFTTEVSLEPKLDKYGLNFDIIIDINWKISNIELFKIEFEKYIFNVKKYHRLYMDGDKMEHLLDGFLIHNSDFNSYIKGIENDKSVMNLNLFDSFKNLEKKGITINSLKRKKYDTINILWNKINDEKSFVGLISLLKDRALFPYD